MQTEGKRYTAAEVAALCSRIRNSIAGLVGRNSELALVQEKLNDVIRNDADPLREVEALLEAFQKSFLEFRHLLNPIGLPLHLTNDGRIRTQAFQQVAAFVTDIRGFTELTINVEKRWNIGIFEVLSFCYFPHLVEVLDRFQCHYLNYTGDGLLVLSQGRFDGDGRLTMPSLDNAVLCAFEMTAVTNAIAESWKRQGFVQANGIWHETGLGMAAGTVHVGDPFVPDSWPDASSPLAEFHRIFRPLAEQSNAHFQPREQFSRRIEGIHALSPIINRASRLQDLDKSAPRHTCMITAAEVAQLCPPLRGLFEPVGQMHLKGIGDAEVFGFDRYTTIDVKALEQECRAYFAERPA